MVKPMSTQKSVEDLMAMSPDDRQKMMADMLTEALITFRRGDLSGTTMMQAIDAYINVRIAEVISTMNERLEKMFEDEPDPEERTFQ
jgi:hypothetical protein